MRREVPGVADDQLAALRPGEFDQLPGVGGAEHHRLFQHDVQARLQAGAGDLEMLGVPDGDDGAVELLLLQHFAEIGVGALDAVRFGGLGQDFGTQVRGGHELRLGVGEDGGEVGGRRPPPGADDADSCLVSHGDLGFGKKGWVF